MGSAFTVLGGSTSPAESGAAVTPSDSTDLTDHALVLHVGSSGNVTLITTGGNTLTFYNVPSGSILPVRCTRVLATGTTASNIVALW